MVYFVTCNPVHAYPVYPTFLDVPDDTAWNGIRYEQNPETLDLRASEREAATKGLSAIEHGYRVIGDSAPRKLLWKGGKKKLPEIIQKNCKAVSPRFRDLVEQFEPGVHQFFPVAIYKAKDGEPIANYYWINVCNRIDSVNIEMTNYDRRKDYTGREFWSNLNVENPRLVISIEKTKNFHLWYDGDLPGPRSFYCSNVFAAAAQEADFPGLTLTPKEEA